MELICLEDGGYRDKVQAGVGGLPCNFKNKSKASVIEGLKTTNQ